jgi:hypothetical protein
MTPQFGRVEIHPVGPVGDFQGELLRDLLVEDFGTLRVQGQASSMLQTPLLQQLFSGSP